MKRSLLLINPWIYDFAAYDFWLKPVGLLSIAGLLRRYGYSITLLDCMDRYHPAILADDTLHQPKNKPGGVGNFHREVIRKPDVYEGIPRQYARYGLPMKLFHQQLNQLVQPDAVLVTSGMTYWYPGVFEIIRQVKSCWENVPILLGGTYATLCHDHARKFSSADAVIPGPGERATLEYLDSIFGTTTDFSDFPQTPDEFPYPAYDLYSYLPAVPIITSYGCPFNCSFCASHLLYPQFIQRDPRAVFDEICFYSQEYGVKNFPFWDDALLVRPNTHFSALADLLIQRNVPASFHLPNGTHAHNMTADIAEKMKMMNMTTITLSFESIAPERQKEMQKVTTQDLVQAVANLEKAGYLPEEIWVYLLMGLPGQSKSEVRESIKFVHNLGCRIRLSAFSPIPGTRDWQKLVAENKLNPQQDPLLSNNSIYPLHRSEEEYAEFDELNRWVRELNQRVKSGSV